MAQAGPGAAARRWRRLVRARLAELESLGVTLDPAFWDARARRLRAGVFGAAHGDPFLARARRSVGRRTTVLDVGAGPGRFSLALAPAAQAVVAVDPSPVMLAMLRRQSRRLGLSNVHCVEGRWEDVDVPPADVSICSYVLPLVADAATFLAKLHATSRRRAFVYMGAMSADAVFDPFWRHFHGRPRRPGPTYLDAVAVLEELGLGPEVEVVEVPSRARFKSLAAAVADYRESLLLPDTPEIRRELRGLLDTWLVKRDGALQPPLRTLPAAILSWAPGGASPVDAR